MKICLVNPGYMEINLDKWGAIEKIVDCYKKELEKKGHVVDIVDLKDAMHTKGYDIIHTHTLQYSSDGGEILTFNNFIPNRYILSVHDHHIFRSEEMLKRCLEVSDHADFTIVHGKNVAEKLDRKNVRFLSHGVDTDKYKNLNLPREGILCLANNGYINDPTADRKGFIKALNVAKALDMSITFAGPRQNQEFFKVHPEFSEYRKAKIIYDPNEKEIVELYNRHAIFLNFSELEAGHPNLTLIESLACGLPVVGLYDGYETLPGQIVLKYFSIEKACAKINKISLDYDKYATLAEETGKEHSWSKIVDNLLCIYESSIRRNKMVDVMTNDIYSGSIDTIQKGSPTYGQSRNVISLTYFDGCKIEITGGDTLKNYEIEFYDQDTDQLVYRTELATNSWASPSPKYFVNWKVKVNDKEYSKLDLKDKKVLLIFSSSALGDNISWMPYAEDFQKKHNCQVHVSSFWNHIFEKEYPELKFVEPKDRNLIRYDVSYQIGCFDNDYSRNKIKWNRIPMQQIATDILGLDYMEKNARIGVVDMPIDFEKDEYITLGIDSTAQAKLWNKEGAWQDLVNLIRKDYPDLKIVLLGKNRSELDGVIDKVGLKIEETINYIKKSKLFIGLGSGLSWLSNSLDVPTVLISGFSNPFTEFTPTVRIHNPKVCNSCFNKYDFDRGNWAWCPTKSDFICTKTIEPEDVYRKIKSLLE